MKTLTEFSTLYLRRAAASRAARAGEGLEADALVAAIAGDLAIQEDRAKRVIEALDLVGNDLDRVRLVRVFQGETGQTGPIGSTTIGEFHYSVDRVVQPGRGDKRRGDRDDRRGGDRDRGRGGGGGGGPGGGGGGFGGGRDRDKPRGLGSLMAAASGEKKEDREDRPQRGEIPRAGIGWQLQSAPRDPRDDRGGPRRGRGKPGDRRGPRGPRPEGDRRGPGGGGPGGGPGGPGGRGPGGRDRRFGAPGEAAPGAEAGAAGGPGGGPGGPGGNRPDREGGPGGERRGRRGGRGRGRGGAPGGPGGPGGPRGERRGGAPGQTGPVNSGQATPVEAQTGSAEAAAPVTPPTSNSGPETQT